MPRTEAMNLTDDEIHELARVFPPGPSARTLLHRAGFPGEHVPSQLGVTPLEFWYTVAAAISAGMVEDGRRQLLVTAGRDFPHNAVFRAVTRERLPVGHVLVVGAGPHGSERVRADRELRAIQQATAGGPIAVDYCPAADVTDLGRVLDVRPDLLHLVCHGEGEQLVFEDPYGDAHRVPARDVAGLLRAYARHAGAELRGLVLASCDSEAVAELFTGVAETVVAHRGPLDDETAVLYARELYGLLERVPALDDAARIAAEHVAVALGDGYGEQLKANLVVLGPGGER
ncbi:CHAT domain-containing protein [Streptomyces sp. ISL-98]|uniref:effector-associated domain EAD1-containing protein n=1 Tax=Streptomyces sp. ISL-98 TaxID=2819192 RepID=UPI001BE52195|nr:effector-associated domain EAD1-containing protein [Streptomyces sp. ISL-98]MBT2510179.1 CHAT domain-containing protein [Streptomyces sp. ISL-98]